MRTIYNLNYEWQFQPHVSKDLAQLDASKFEAIDLPHTNCVLPYNYLNEQAYQFVSCYRKSVALTPKANKRTFLRFYGVQVSCELYLDQVKIGEHFGGYDAFDIELTPYIETAKSYTLDVVVDASEQADVPPFGNVVDYLTYGGIYREVELLELDNVHLQSFFCKPRFEKQWFLDVEVERVGNQAIEVQLWLEGSLVQTKRSEETTLTLAIEEGAMWDVEHPTLYDVFVHLLDGEEVVDRLHDKIGLRTCVFQADGFYLNGKKLKLRGLNRHQAYAYVGYAMPKSMQEQDADLLKWTLGCNIVRTSHYPQSKHFIRRCDEIGLLVFTEIPGWQFVSQNEKWRNLTLQATRSMVMQYRNHPSIVLWGVRINESQDDHELYTQTNAIAKQLDPTRSTGGVRFITHSELLEDVYTFNDFSHRGDNPGLQARKKVTKHHEKAYLVTEYNGHMYPTKRFDDEAHRLSHALRHAAVLESMYAQETIAGCIGWCMNDYNTHQDFGSGDKICHHGVMDMFRMPKLAASVYASQQDNTPVLSISSTMNIGEHPAGELKRVVAFTNCDMIKLYKNGLYIQSFAQPSKKDSKLPHPIIEIDDFIGDQLERVEGYPRGVANEMKAVLNAIAKYGQDRLPLVYKAKMAKLMVVHGMSLAKGYELYGKYIGNWGQKALEYRFEGYQKGTLVTSCTRNLFAASQMSVKASHTVLQETLTYDVAQLFIEMQDQDGNVLPYFNQPVHFTTEGPIALLSPESVSFL
ncbi:MAG: glycoside hydrolase family 2 TIM barrel-domain containing protein, partial [Erysipelotrichaceae bacterium]